MMIKLSWCAHNWEKNVYYYTFNFIVRIHTQNNRPESRVWNQLECSKCSDKWVTGQIWWSEASTENIYELMMNLPLFYYQCVQHKCAQLIVIISWFHGCSMRWIEILSLLFFSLKKLISSFSIRLFRSVVCRSSSAWGHPCRLTHKNTTQQQRKRY